MEFLVNQQGSILDLDAEYFELFYEEWDEETNFWNMLPDWSK